MAHPSRKLKKLSCFFYARNPGERRAHTCHARTVKSPSSSGATMNPLFLPPPTRAARSCFLNTTKSRNTISTRMKSPTKKSCSRPMCRRNFSLTENEKQQVPSLPDHYQVPAELPAFEYPARSRCARRIRRCWNCGTA